MSDNSNDGDNYEVGYKKPPIHSRFRKGKSGNPAGRPKGRKNLKTILVEELATLIQITEGGRVRTVSKLTAIIMRTVVKAMEGDMRAVDRVFRLVETHLLDDDARREIEAALSPDDQAILNRFLATHAAREGGHKKPDADES